MGLSRYVELAIRGYDYAEAMDTSTWLDLAKRRDGLRWIVALRVLIHHGEVTYIDEPPSTGAPWVRPGSS